MRRGAEGDNSIPGLKIFLYKILFKSNIQQQTNNHSVARAEPTHHEPEPAETRENRNRPTGASILRLQSMKQ